ncbi:hypothetical protein BGX27_010228 [Mortierella sp. AM989]|nr:hypothetical protein BGX27_010228 [Mortierella sp. AM989]
MIAKPNTLNNPASTPVSAASTPAPSPHIVLPSEAAAILQSLLQDNNIMSSSTNLNTFSRDFCLFESDEAQFDYPLFESIKLQHQHPLHPLHQLNALQQHAQLQLHHHQQQQQAQHIFNTNSNPLCTPQTPSLDLPENARATDTYGFDSFSAFLEESASTSASAAAVALIHVNDMTSHLANVNGGNGVDFSTLHFASSQTNLALVETPFTPYLDTPFETPYLSDLSEESEIANSNRVLFGHDNSCGGIGNDNGRVGGGVSYSSAPLFHEFDFEIHASALGGCAFDNTIEPATLLMASPATQQEFDYNQESDSSFSISDDSSCSISDDSSCSASDDSSASISSASTSSASVSPLIQSKSAHDNSFHKVNGGFEQGYEDFETSGSDLSLADDDDEDEEDEEDDDDDEFIPSRSLAATTSGPSSGYKRKAPPTINYGRNFDNVDIGMASTTPSKRTRPELASPYGGKKRSPKKQQTNAARRFPCKHPGCELRFARLYNLHTHERTHDPDQVRPFICSAVHCRKGFSRKHDLQRHEASVHKGERNYRCQTCSKPFSRQDGLRRHLTVKSSACAVSSEVAQAMFGNQNEPRWSTT